MKKRIIRALACIVFTAALTFSSAAATINGYYGDNTDYAYEYADIAGDTAIATVNDEELPAELYTYWVAYYERQVYDNFDMGDADVDWDGYYQATSVTLEDYVKSASLQTAAVFMLVEQKAEELGVTLTDAQQEELNSYEENQVSEYGLEGYYESLKYNCASSDMIIYMNGLNMLFENIVAQECDGASVDSDEADELMTEWKQDSSLVAQEGYESFDIQTFYDNYISALSEIDPDYYN